MKYFLLGLCLFILASCNKAAKIEFTGTTPGIKSGTFVIKNLRDSTLYGVNIKDEKFEVSGILPAPGYYTMDIVDDTSKSSHERHFEVYLEGGKYAIETEKGKLYKYPKITSPSKIQSDLSDYNTLVTQLPGSAQQDNDAGFKALKQFVKDHPQSTISAHLMYKMEYNLQPETYFEIFKTFSPEAKNSDEGKEIGDKLGHLVKLAPGAQSPALAGKMPDGKPFDPSILKRKVILIDFWRASNQISRQNHLQMQNLLLEFKGKNAFGIVSVSIDSKTDWWTKAIKEDNMRWPQVSDLKGDDSQNAANWAVSQIPTYSLVDGNWKIIARDIQLQEVPVYVNEYLNKH
jgi:hypothetical protein